MKNPSLERFYIKIHRSILLAQKYTEIENLDLLIRACRLKPVLTRPYKLELYRDWADEFGNLLKIINNKRVEIVYNSLEFHEKNICTDIYYGLSLEKIARISKLGHFIVGEDEDNQGKYIFLTFLGIDNYLRSYLFINDEWTHVSPLLLGIRRLQNIFRNTDIKYFHELSCKKDNMIPCKDGSEWISFIPPSWELIEILKRQHEVDFSSLFTKE